LLWVGISLCGQANLRWRAKTHHNVFALLADFRDCSQRGLLLNTMLLLSLF
jgi:hypothetical protein